MPVKPRAVIFDAYGTLFDIRSVVRRGGTAGDSEALSDLWRRKQLETTWLLALMERYVNFRQVTESALRASVRQLRIEATETQLQELMEAYLAPSIFPEVTSALDSLKSVPLAILSNGTAEMVEAAVANAGLASQFAHIISVDRVKTYKPSPRVYALGPEILRIPAAEILFVSANAWDAAGAKAYGYQVCWCNRASKRPAAEPDDVGFAPDFTIARLDEIAGVSFDHAEGPSAN